MMLKQNNIVGIFLAAGKSTRMGKSKLLLPLGNEALGTHALHTALGSNLSHIVVVARDDDQSLNHWQSFLTEKVTVVSCSDSVKGLSYSLNYGISVANSSLAPDGAMILLADQPFIPKKLINQLIDVFNKEEILYVASSYKDIICPPVLIGKPLFPLLKQLKRDEGVKKLLTDYPSIKGKVIQNESQELFIDIDTMEDYEAVLTKFNLH
ncbi:NTP transferase domain-containing protein [Pseudoneobacillus sp. C159]